MCGFLFIIFVGIAKQIVDMFKVSIKTITDDLSIRRRLASIELDINLVKMICENYLIKNKALKKTCDCDIHYLKPKHDHHEGCGFLITIGRYEDKQMQATVYLGKIESHIFTFLNRSKTKLPLSNNDWVGNRNSTRCETVLMLQVEADLACFCYSLKITPLNHTSFEPIRSYNPYYNSETIWRQYTYDSDEKEVGKVLYCLAFSCFSLMNNFTPKARTYNYTFSHNIYSEIMRKAEFRSEFDCICELIRFYKHEVSFANSNAPNVVTGNFLVTYNAEDMIQPWGDCFSNHYQRSENNLVASIHTENSDFQLIVGYGTKPGSNIQFFIHVTDEIFSEFKRRCIPKAYTDGRSYGTCEEESASYNFEFFEGRQRAQGKTIQKLKHTVLLSLLIRLYREKVVGVGIFLQEDLSYVLTMANTVIVFEELSKYVFENFFELSTMYFEGHFDATYCILFTCITLSDERFIQQSSLSGVNATMINVILYFKSIFLMYKNPWLVKDSVIWSEPEDLMFHGTWTHENQCFGLSMMPFDFLSLSFMYERHNYLKTVLKDYVSSQFTSSSLNVTIVKTNR